MHAIEIFNKADTYYILIVPSKMQMSNCIPTLQHLVDIIRKQEVLNIANIVNLVPQVFINKNQSTDKCVVLCFTSTRECFAVDGQHWFRRSRRGRSNLNRSLVQAFLSMGCSRLVLMITQLLQSLR
jgi:hypothetical protein